MTLSYPAMDSVGQADVTDEEIFFCDLHPQRGSRFYVVRFEKYFVSLYNKFKNMDLDEEQLREQVHKVYDKLESLGVTKEDVKEYFRKTGRYGKRYPELTTGCRNLDIKDK